jgi:glyoxylate/hydroxypyruvate reductase A
MDILFQSAESDPQPWIDGFQAALPEARIRMWQAGDDDAADYAIVWKPPQAMLRGRSDLKAIFNLGAGVDAILQYGNALPDVPLIRLDDAGMGLQMAEYVTHAVLRHFRRFGQYERQARERRWDSLPPREKQDCTVGILGLGVLGTQVAAAVRYFGFPVAGWSRSAKKVSGVACHHGKEGLGTFLRASNVVVCALPMTEETRGILNRATLEKLPADAYVINVARGAHIVEADLLALIRGGRLSGAALDVFSEEPLPPDHPFWQEPNITITPHIAALTLRTETIVQVVGKIRALEQGRPVAGMVDRTKGY